MGGNLNINYLTDKIKIWYLTPNYVLLFCDLIENIQHEHYKIGHKDL